MKTPREVVQDWVTAYNRRNAYTAAELYHENATNFQVALGDPTVGRQAMLDDLLSFFHVVDGKIWYQCGYFDKATWFGQLGIPLA